MRKTWLIARTVLIEAIRRKEIYAIVFLTVGLIGVVGSIRFFNIEGLGKFYREIALKTMGIATVLTVVVLAARQLPREFKNRTILPLLAKPVSRTTFLIGKFVGVMLAAVFCYGLFAVVFVLGNLYLKSQVNWPVFAQAVYLQMLALSVIASLSFLLSMVLNLDAAVTLSVLIYVLGQLFTATLSLIYENANAATKVVLSILNFAVPQLTLFDLSGKVVHGDVWGPIGFWAMRNLTLYALLYTTIFFVLSYLIFRKRTI